MDLRSPAVFAVIGVASTLVLTLSVVISLAVAGGPTAVSDNATTIAGLLISGSVFSNQLVNMALEDRRSQEAHKLEDQRAHEAALQNYFENVGALLIEQPSRHASTGDNLGTVARAQTLAVLKGLDPERKRILLQFLYEAGLIHKAKPIVSLVSADLSDADLSGADLSEADLSEADLSGAILNNVDLSGVNLSGVVGITMEALEQKAYSLKGATMPDGSKHP